MRAIVTLTIILVIGSAVGLFGQVKTKQKPYILEVWGGCYPHELSIEYFITGAFGGYGSFVKTDSRFFRYEIPAVREGKAARSMKVMVRSARCRTVVIDIPQVEEGGRVIRARLRRSLGLDFRGAIVSPEALIEKGARVTVEYWANWKCEFIGVTDCLIGPNRIDSVDLKADGRFRFRLPNLLDDPTLSEFTNKGTFQVFVRDRKTGDVLYNLRPATSNSRSIVPAAVYPGEMEFIAESENNMSIREHPDRF